MTAGVLAIALLTALIFLDTRLKDQRWAVYLAAIPGYFLLQVFAEGALEGLWSAGRWAGKLFAIAALVAFYVLWLWQP
jgi:hypothetical protein